MAIYLYTLSAPQRWLEMDKNLHVNILRYEGEKEKQHLLYPHNADNSAMGQLFFFLIYKLSFSLPCFFSFPLKLL